MTYWPDAKACFKRHIGLSSKALTRAGLHESTRNKYLSLVGQASGEGLQIEVLIDEHKQQVIRQNREKLVSIIDTIKLCGRLGLALRGHRDDSSYHPEVGSYSKGGVDSNRNVREDFVRFLHCKWGLSGESLEKLIHSALTELKLSIEDCRGQGYDGAGAVAGHINGLSARILRLNSKAIYTHCYSHRLNLAICNSCSVPFVRNVFSQIKELSYFFNLSDGRQMLLSKAVEDYCPHSGKSKLKDVCRTRWIERIDGLDIFQELFLPIFHTLTEMSHNAGHVCNPETSSKASSFLALISTFRFIVSLVISRNILDLTLPVTQLLQAKTCDVMDGMHLIESLKNLGILLRNDVDLYHGKWYSEAVSLAKNVDVDEKMPRTAGRQVHNENHPSSSASDYYKKALTIPFLDHLNSDLQARFDFSQINVYNGFSVVPSKMISLINSLPPNKKNWKENFRLDAELELWEKFWTTYEGSLPDSAASTLKALGFEGFENIKACLRLLATLPVTSCECERSISALRMLKTYNRSTMVEERLNGLALMRIHQEIEPTVDEVINKFAYGNRRLELKL
ncbi:52 kDa repressor of the inhibitor of the protein kinase-like [Xenia sp. Carnegie-2017]|uniref:52 kDa repressor of the inhibitor of the protein kinase-like n=1 Tax=Xenia sp. Carnegie-2017 TaxID=2897299 RepID=UPI001F040B78|nr:52 kDa repressor of the inhibitor of the protein kinase-like [Xenia sp. Carnegie-2017]